MWYVYIIQSLQDNSLYTGCTNNLKNRLNKHKKGKVVSTRSKKPYKLIYYEACLNKTDAFHRERYLKSGWGTRWIKQRIKCYLE